MIQVSQQLPTFAVDMRLKEKYAEYKLNKMYKSIMRQPVFPDLYNIRHVGVIWQPSVKDAYLFLKDFFKMESVIFRGFCVFDDLANPQSGTNAITSAELDWWGMPKKGITEDFIEKEFDLLLNLGLKQTYVLRYITALSKAKFKVGWSPETFNYFDLNINIGEKEEAMYLAKQQIFYLAQLNKKSSNE